MPLPLGHLAIGLATHELSSDQSAFGRWKLFAVIIVLANLPDIDVIFGLLIEWNGSAFHRGPTHSLLFALAFGFLVSRASRIWRGFPQLGFPACFALILSHLAADALLSISPVSWLWPLATNWSAGHSGWQDVFGMVLTGNAQDAILILSATAVIMAQRMARALRAGLIVRLRRISGHPAKPIS